MTDEQPEALRWVDEEQLASRVTREEPSFATLIHGDPSVRPTIDYWIELQLQQKARHVRRG